MSDGLRCRPAFLGDSRSCPRVCGVDHLSRRLGLSSEARGVDQISRGTRVRVQVPVGSTSCQDNLRTGLMTCRVNQLSRETRAKVRGTAGSTSYPGRLGPLPVDRRARAAVAFDLGPIPRDRGTTSCPGLPVPVSESSHGYQLLQATRARFRGPAGSTSSLGRLAHWSDFLRGRPAFPDDWCPGPRNRGVNQHSLVTRARV